MGTKKVIPRILVGSVSGHAGKTVISAGLARTISRMGYKVQTFKKGPDYIDASWLEASSGRTCRNLDYYLFGERLCEHFLKHSSSCDFVIIEGNMGLFDGIGEEGEGSSAHIARLLKTPVILVVNTEKITRSVAAIVEGYRNFEKGTDIKGVILNRVSGERHKSKLLKAIERYCEVPVLGVIPRLDRLEIGERHLGLIPSWEYEKREEVLESIGDLITRYVDVDGVIEIGKRVGELELDLDSYEETDQQGDVTIGVLKDRAFHFYYPENLEALVSEGARLVTLDSTKDRSLSGLDGLYIGGGFPELNLEALSANRELMREIYSFIEEGGPVYAECGGLMYLCERIVFSEKVYEMVGAIPADVFIGRRPQGHGYVSAQVILENPYFPTGVWLKGHEFHHSTLRFKKRVDFALRLARGKGVDGLNDGILYKNLFASFTHIHALGCEAWGKRFVSLCREMKEKKKVSSYIGEASYGRRN